MSENEIVEPEPTEGEYDDGGYGNTPVEEDPIIPIFMRKGADYAQLGDAIYDSETMSMVVKFNTDAGRDIARFIDSGVLSGISFGAMMSRTKITNALN